MRMGALVSHTVILTPRTRMLIPATIYLNDITLLVMALVDSGTEENFIDCRLVQQDLALVPLEILLVDNALNGGHSAKVIYRTQLLKSI